jgi:uncharacterized protein YukE
VVARWCGGADSLAVAARFWETAGLRRRLVDASGGRWLAPVARCCNKIWIWLKFAGGCGGVRIQAGIVIQINSGRPGGRSLMWGGSAFAGSQGGFAQFLRGLEPFKSALARLKSALARRKSAVELSESALARLKSALARRKSALELSKSALERLKSALARLKRALGERQRAHELRPGSMRTFAGEG